MPAPMLTLGIETATDVCAVALLTGDRVVAEGSVHLPRSHAARLAPLIHQTLAHAGRAPGDIDLVAVSAGPGSYTGLRIGVSTAKGLCLATGAALVAVPTLEALAYAAVAGLPDGPPVVAVLPSRRGEVYVAEFARRPDGVRPLRAPVPLPTDQLATWIGGSAVLAGPMAPDVAAGLRGVTAVDVRPSAVAVAQIGRRQAEAGNGADPASFEPIYLKPFVPSQPGGILAPVRDAPSPPMAWFRRQSAGIQTPRNDRNEAPEGYWLKCPQCGTITSQRELEENLRVCPSCGHHHPMPGMEYLRLLFDGGSFTRYDADLHSVDPLDFTDRKAYSARIAAAEAASGLNDAAVSGTGDVGGHPTSIAAMDFSFIGGSMGSVVGEIVARAVRRAADEDRACLVISQSGGARMMEGALSLMQMAKTSANLAVLAEKRLPFVSLLTHPTTGGVTASFAMLGDLNLAEPGALIGFAGPRVIRETIGRDLPPGFQTAEFLVEKGFIDRIVPRTDLRSTLVHVLDLLAEGA